MEGVHYLPEEAPEVVAPGVAAFWTSSGGLRNISYHCVRNSLHRSFHYRTLRYVMYQDK